MLATLNLQLNTFELSAETPSTAISLSPEATDSRGEDAADFSAVLRSRVDTTLQSTSAGGGFLPAPGNTLPPTSQPTDITLTVDDVAAENVTATLPGIEYADESPPTLGTDIDAGAETGLTLPPMDVTAALHDSRREIGTVLHAPVLRAASDELTQVTPADASERVAEPEIPLVLPRADVVLRAPELPLASADSNPIAAAVVVLAERSTSKPLLRPAAAVLGGEHNVTIPATPKPLDAMTIHNSIAAPDKVVDTPRLPISGIPKLQASGTQSSSAPLLTAGAPLASAAPAFAADLELASGVIATPVRDVTWGERVSERVLMLAGSQLKSAEIRLTPAELGPLRVHIAIDEGVANVAFQSQHAVTREAIEQALPRLRELLTENGLTLGQSSVSEQGVSKEHQEQSSASTTRSAATESDAGVSTGEDQAAVLPQRVVDGLVDTFA